MKRDFADQPGRKLVTGLDRCKQCDAPLDGDATQCHECGAPVNPPKMADRFEAKSA